MLKALWSGIFSVLQVLAFALGLFFFLYLLVMRPHKIKGESMMPNFPNAEYLLTERVSYYFRATPWPFVITKSI
jgi:signal peptidase I